ncbi:MAG: tetratricopeptide repeat protein [Polyangiaceae bacterium]
MTNASPNRRARWCRSPRGRALSAIAAALALVVVLPEGAARADSPPAASKDKEKEKEAARALAEQGYDLFTDGKYIEAAQKLDEAEAIFHAPTHLELAGRALEKAGKLLAARDRYQRAVAEAPSPKWSKGFQKSYADAQRELLALKPRIPTLQIKLSGVEPDKASVTVDGASSSAADYASPRDVDPGAVTLQIDAPGMASEVRDLTLKEGEKRSIDVTLRARVDGRGPLAPGVIGVSVGAVSLAIGAVTGAMSLGAVSNLDKACPDKRCPATEAGELSRAKTLSTVSTVGFSAGAALAAAGAVLLLVRPFGAAETKVGGARVTPLVGPGFVGLKGEL